MVFKFPNGSNLIYGLLNQNVQRDSRKIKINHQNLIHEFFHFFDVCEQTTMDYAD